MALDRGVNHPQVFQPMHPAVLVDDGQRSRSRAHFAGAGAVRGVRDVLQQPLLQCGIRSQILEGLASVHGDVSV